MNPVTRFLPVILFIGIFLSQEAISQNKFEFGVSIDPLIVPVDFVTYIEHGQGFYNINGKGEVSQAGSAYFSYWPFKIVGFSLGAGIRTFRSKIDYTIPDPFDESLEPIIERTYPFSAKGWGPSLSLLFRTEKWRGRIGLGIFDLYNQEYTSNSSITGVTVWESGEIIAHIQVEEQAYWYTAPNSYGFLQLEGQYNILDNIFIKFGMETTIGKQYPYPYKLLISGFTPETGSQSQSQVLNDFKMQNSLTSFSFGVVYLIGFGNYNSERNIQPK